VVTPDADFHRISERGEPDHLDESARCDTELEEALANRPPSCDPAYDLSLPRREPAEPALSGDRERSRHAFRERTLGFVHGLRGGKQEAGPLKEGRQGAWIRFDHLQKDPRYRLIK
jgi:hypothetical protein